MDILVVFDHGFVMPTGVMLKSLSENNKDIDLHCHAIVNDSVTEKDRQTLFSAFDSCPNNDITFYSINKEVFPRLPLSPKHQFPEASYYRLFAASVLPEHINKVLYLDGDTIVTEDLYGLWSVNIDSVAVAGVLDVLQDPGHYNRINIKRDKGYINAGVLLINLEYWRKNGVEERFFDYLEKNNPEYADQDVINYVLQDEKKILPIQYNLMTPYLYKQQNAPFFYADFEEEVRFARRHPVIIHFVSGDKPWFRDSNHPFKDYFLKYYRMTPWADIPLKKKKIDVKELIKYLLYRVGWIHQNVMEDKFDK